jgi:hypothetical protein
VAGGKAQKECQNLKKIISHENEHDAGGPQAYDDEKVNAFPVKSW